jgi:hypothetical protein
LIISEGIPPSLEVNSAKVVYIIHESPPHIPP